MNEPFVSVIMPVRNEAAYLERSLKAVLSQDYPKDKMEILIADGMSGDGTRELILSFIKSDPRIKLIDNPSGKTPSALNLAMSQAQGDILIRVDGHAVIAPDYVKQCVHILASGTADAVGGPIETVGETFSARAIAAAMSSPFGVGNSAFRVSKARQFADTVPFPAYPKIWVEKAGFYDEEMIRNQDDEYNYRLRALGARVLLDPLIKSRYYSRASLTSLAKQYFQYGFWKVRVLQKHPEGMSWRQFAPPVFAGLVGILPFVPGLKGLWPILISSYLVFIVTGAFVTALRSGFGILFLLPFVFFTLHFSYGAGFLAGLVYFLPRWFSFKK